MDGSEIESRQGANFSLLVQTDPGAQTAFYIMGTGSLSREWSDRGVALIAHSHLMPRVRGTELLPLRNFVDCARVVFTELSVTVDEK